VKNICVFLGSRSGLDAKFARAAEELGALLAQNHLRLVYGGGRVGLMGILADAVLKHGGEVIGVIPTYLFSEEVAHNGLTELMEVRSMHERKALMENLAAGFIAMPGGFGTLDEVCEIITWAQIGLHQKPVGFLNTAGFFNPFIEFVTSACTAGFIPQDHVSRLIITEKPLEMIHELRDRIT
jgi:uncharacterized protein (TIGR00730 family)